VRCTRGQSNLGLAVGPQIQSKKKDRRQVHQTSNSPTPHFCSRVARDRVPAPKPFLLSQIEPMKLAFAVAAAALSLGLSHVAASSSSAQRRRLVRVTAHQLHPEPIEAANAEVSAREREGQRLGSRVPRHLLLLVIHFKRVRAASDPTVLLGVSTCDPSRRRWRASGTCRRTGRCRCRCRCRSHPRRRCRPRRRLPSRWPP
jgi:hypothetical protein